MPRDTDARQQKSFPVRQPTRRWLLARLRPSGPGSQPALLSRPRCSTVSSGGWSSTTGSITPWRCGSLTRRWTFSPPAPTTPGHLSRPAGSSTSAGMFSCCTPMTTPSSATGWRAASSTTFPLTPVRSAIWRRRRTRRSVERSPPSATPDATPTSPPPCTQLPVRCSARPSPTRKGPEVTCTGELPDRVAPRLRWHAEAEGWLVLGFDHVPGRHADLAPGSTDLTAVAATVTTLTDSLAHHPADPPRLAEQWERLSAWRRIPEAIWMAGPSVTSTSCASGRRGAPNSPMATASSTRICTRLVAAGHTPDAAERWANNLPVWRAATSTARTAYAVAIWGIWTYQNVEQPRPVWDKLVPAACDWARHRLRVA